MFTWVDAVTAEEDQVLSYLDLVGEIYGYLVIGFLAQIVIYFVISVISSVDGHTIWNYVWTAGIPAVYLVGSYVIAIYKMFVWTRDDIGSMIPTSLLPPSMYPRILHFVISLIPTWLVIIYYVLPCLLWEISDITYDLSKKINK